MKKMQKQKMTRMQNKAHINLVKISDSIFNLFHEKSANEIYRKFVFIENKKERKINILFKGQLYATVSNSLFNYVRFFEKSKPENIKNK